MLEIIIDDYGDFIESKDYHPESKSTSWITNLENFITNKMHQLGTTELTIKFIKEGDNESNS
ncbi:MAG: hypothetical protein EOM67_03605 [Spirochaetia bacterium]|nr:hypothetical protein [Spirochaetia bacterium]